MTIDTSLEFVPINIAVLTISDTRTSETDTSGALLQDRINSAGHHCIEKLIIADDVKIIKDPNHDQINHFFNLKNLNMFYFKKLSAYDFLTIFLFLGSINSKSIFFFFA